MLCYDMSLLDALSSHSIQSSGWLIISSVNKAGEHAADGCVGHA